MTSTNFLPNHSSRLSSLQLHNSNNQALKNWSYHPKQTFDSNTSSNSSSCISNVPPKSRPPITAASTTKSLPPAPVTASLPLTKRRAARNEKTLFNLIHSVPGNDICADCSAPYPVWASWNLGIFLCIRCASLHRKLGTHISKVKSLSMDSWNNDQVDNMKLVGNSNSNRRLNPRNVLPPIPLNAQDADIVMERYIRQKYIQKTFSNKGTSRNSPDPPALSTYPRPTPAVTSSPPECSTAFTRVNIPAKINDSRSGSSTSSCSRSSSSVCASNSSFSSVGSGIDGSSTPLFLYHITQNSQFSSHPQPDSNVDTLNPSIENPTVVPDPISSLFSVTQSTDSFTPSPPKSQSDLFTLLPRANFLSASSTSHPPIPALEYSSAINSKHTDTFTSPFSLPPDHPSGISPYKPSTANPISSAWVNPTFSAGHGFPNSSALFISPGNPFSSLIENAASEPFSPPNIATSSSDNTNSSAPSLTRVNTSNTSTKGELIHPSNSGEPLVRSFQAAVIAPSLFPSHPIPNQFPQNFSTPFEFNKQPVNEALQFQSSSPPSLSLLSSSGVCSSMHQLSLNYAQAPDQCNSHSVSTPVNSSKNPFLNSDNLALQNQTTSTFKLRSAETYDVACGKGSQFSETDFAQKLYSADDQFTSMKIKSGSKNPFVRSNTPSTLPPHNLDDFSSNVPPTSHKVEGTNPFKRIIQEKSLPAVKPSLASNRMYSSIEGISGSSQNAGYGLFQTENSTNSSSELFTYPNTLSAEAFSSIQGQIHSTMKCGQVNMGNVNMGTFNYDEVPPSSESSGARKSAILALFNQYPHLAGTNTPLCSVSGGQYS